MSYQITVPLKSLRITQIFLAGALKLSDCTANEIIVSTVMNWNNCSSKKSLNTMSLTLSKSQKLVPHFGTK